MSLQNVWKRHTDWRHWFQNKVYKLGDLGYTSNNFRNMSYEGLTVKESYMKKWTPAKLKKINSGDRNHYLKKLI